MQSQPKLDFVIRRFTREVHVGCCNIGYSFNCLLSHSNSAVNPPKVLRLLDQNI